MVFKSLKTGRDALRRVRSCCRTLVVAGALCVAAAASPSLADGLPAGYTQLPYIKANANVQVKTGYTPKSTDKIVMTWCPVRVNATEALWCARSSTNSKRNAFTAFQQNSTGKIWIIYNDSSAPTDTSNANFTLNKCDRRFRHDRRLSRPHGTRQRRNTRIVQQYALRHVKGVQPLQQQLCTSRH